MGLGLTLFGTGPAQDRRRPLPHLTAAYGHVRQSLNPKP